MHQKKLDEMGHLHLLLDEMGLDKMGLDEMGTNRTKMPGMNYSAYPQSTDVIFGY